MGVLQRWIMIKIRETSLYPGELYSYCDLKCTHFFFISDIGLKILPDSWTELVPHKGSSTGAYSKGAILNENSIFPFLAKDSKINMQLAPLINGFG